MVDWRAAARVGQFAEAEGSMLEETEGKDGIGPDAEVRAQFYEDWGDRLEQASEAGEKYRVAHWYWATFASWSTSGGEGTARMRDVNRVLEKLENLGTWQKH
jgi:hypothetical protein